MFRTRALLIALMGSLPIVSADLCSPTGAGVCNLGLQIVGIDGPSADMYYAWIYNRDCDAIGGNGKEIYPGTAMDSQLKYTVVIKELTYPNMEFCYAGSCYSGGWACDLVKGGRLDCAHAFNC